MKITSLLCLLFLVGCATGGVPREVLDQQNLSAPIYGNPPVTPMFPTDRVVRLVDSRMIQEIIRLNRDEAALSLSGEPLIVTLAAAAAALWYVLNH